VKYGSKRLRQGLGLVACGLAFGGVAGPAAAQGSPNPQPAHSPAHPSIRPDPAPGARGSVATSTTVTAPPSAPRVSTPALTSTPSVSPPTTVQRPARVAKAKTPTRRATVRSSPPPPVDARPLRALASWASGSRLIATSTAAGSSETSLLLLFVGLALVLLTIGETTFLRRAARASKPRREADEQLAIRQVQLRR
jgi:hypothetical protein